MLDDYIRTLTKLHTELALTLIDKLPPELSKTLKTCSQTVYDAVGEAMSAHKEPAPPAPTKSGSITIE